MARAPLPSNATGPEISAAVQAQFDDFVRRLRNLETGRNRAPGSSFGLPFVFVGAAGNWTFSESGGSLRITGPSGTVTVIAPP